MHIHWSLPCIFIACAVASLAHAQGYPAKPIRYVVGFTAGGASDITSRIIGQKLSEHLGQPVIIDNRAGASGTIAAGIVAKAPPDGYTLLSGATSILAINPGLYKKLDYDSLRDFAPVSQTVSMPQLLVVHPGVKAATLKEVEAQGWSLNPGRYVGVAPGEEVSDEDFKAQLEALNEELGTLNAQARTLEQTIAANVARIMEP